MPKLQKNEWYPKEVTFTDISPISPTPPNWMYLWQGLEQPLCTHYQDGPCGDLDKICANCTRLQSSN